MSHTKVTFLIEPVSPWRDLLIAELSQLGYDGFEERDAGPGLPHGELAAWVATEKFDPGPLRQLRALRDPHAHVQWSSEEVPDRNWNAQWEEDFKPVEVAGRVRIRAEHHPSVPGYALELVITPRMAFGTGHHATTRMMVERMLELPLEGARVCDLGCGTAVLAMLAEKLGAAEVLAVDIDPIAVENAMANVVINGCSRVHVEKGDVGSVVGQEHDIILANIERNTLIAGMGSMAGALSPGGHLLLSGFIAGDMPAMEAAAHRAGMDTLGTSTEGEWALMACKKRD